MQEFFAMGGYAQYVWPSYLLFLGVLLGNWGTARRRSRQIRLKILQGLEDNTP